VLYKLPVQAEGAARYARTGYYPKQGRAVRVRGAPHGRMQGHGVAVSVCEPGVAGRRLSPAQGVAAYRL